MKLTDPMRAALDGLIKLKLPPSYVKHGFPGFPVGGLDMRSVAALEKRGFAECIIHEYFVDIHDAPVSHGERRVVVTYRATDAGRAYQQTQEQSK